MTDVHAVMHEQYAEGRAALRANLGCMQKKMLHPAKQHIVEQLILSRPVCKRVEVKYPEPVLDHQFR